MLVAKFIFLTALAIPIFIAAYFIFVVVPKREAEEQLKIAREKEAEELAKFRAAAEEELNQCGLGQTETNQGSRSE